MALTGHSPTHAPQSTQSSDLTKALPSFMTMASVGQVPTQASHPVHVSLLTLAGISIPPILIFIDTGTHHIPHGHKMCPQAEFR